MTAEPVGRVLIVDDDRDVLTAGRLLLKRYTESVEVTETPEALPELLAEGRVDVILLDMNFSRGATSGEEGFHWLGRIGAIDPDAVVIVITAHGGVQTAVEAMKRGASDFISKPWSNERLAATVQNGVALARSRAEARTLRKQNVALASGRKQPLLGTSAAMQQVFSMIERAAPTDANVLILGENGTGKELVARELHRQSKRAEQIFLSVDLGAIADSLFESELFGHKKGAFTDARSDRTGRFEAADRGTIFLDEIGNIPLHLQAKLLTALEQRQVTPLGANRPVSFDVRVISATNVPPSRLAQEDVLRQDLLFRLNTVELHLPALRERREDIPLLAGHFLRLYERKYNRPAKPLADDALQSLRAYHWPGNVRALRHAVERAVILSEDAVYRTADFSLTAPSIPAAAATEQGDGGAADGGDLNLERLERSAIAQALKLYRYNISQAAKALGVSRAALYRRMEKHDL